MLASPVWLHKSIITCLIAVSYVCAGVNIQMSDYIMHGITPSVSHYIMNGIKPPVSETLQPVSREKKAN